MNQPTPVSESVERRTIDHVPVDERHGRARDLFTVWFGSNIMLLTIITGALATTVFGQPLWCGALAVVLGNVVGAVVMALHAAQGPQMGVPQMLQTRAQFGSYGSLLVVVLVIFMYLGFFASNAVLGGQAFAKVTRVPTNWSILIIGIIRRGRDDHRLQGHPAGGRLLSVVAGTALLSRSSWLSSTATLRRHLGPRADSLGRLHVHALGRRPVADRLRALVSDYTRYMPRDTGRARHSGHIRGCVLGSLLPMVLVRARGADSRRRHPGRRREVDGGGEHRRALRLRVGIPPPTR